jgi:glycosyltransferase involved in cell wall biosynthesis
MRQGLVSVILPVHNEAKTLEANVLRLIGVLERTLQDFEIIISEDGSTDDTVQVARTLTSDRVKLLHSEMRLGKGAAIMNAVESARGDIIIFMDADLASEPSHVKELVGYLESGAAIVIGSRYLKESDAKRSISRFAASKGYNWLVRMTLGSRLSDHQCGFKAFRKDLILPIIREVQDRGWFWDTELLVRAQRKGLKVAEIPIGWKEAQTTRFRLLRDSIRMGLSLARFKVKNG